jgi:hypothetical protein
MSHKTKILTLLTLLLLMLPVTVIQWELFKQHVANGSTYQLHATSVKG